jgi:hypothetical protein
MDQKEFIRKKIKLEEEIKDANVGVDFAWEVAINDKGSALRKAEAKRDSAIKKYEELCDEYYGRKTPQKSLGDFGKKRANKIKKKNKR